MDDFPSYYRYWGKARSPVEVDYRTSNGSDREIAARHNISVPELRRRTERGRWRRVSNCEDFSGYHLLVYHLLDVAAVGSVLLGRHHFLRRRLSELTGLTEELAVKWFVFLLGIHDIGKFAETFQQLREDLRVHFWPNQKIRLKNYDPRHDSLGEIVWSQYVLSYLLDSNELSSEVADDLEELLGWWSRPIFGHHGCPPYASVQARRHFTGTDREAAERFCEDWRIFVGVDFSDLKSLEFEQSRSSWLIAGVAVLCDWLGSNQDIFHSMTEREELSLEVYWEKVALVSASKAVERSGVLPATPRENGSLTSLFYYIDTLTPLQQQANDIQFSPIEQLFILEDVTGAGKTEAALILAHRLMGRGLAQGIYIGLPTMATANAMYERMAGTYLNFYKEGEAPSLILSHSARHLSEPFRQSILAASRGGEYGGSSEESITAQCNRWLADSRKKSLLADVGIGTIDQALLGVLPVRHQSLRLLGLANKVLVLDEVHAYDAYTSELLKALIRFHRQLGGSVVLLSATLTQSQRESLAQEFGGRSVISQLPDQYPLLTRVGADGDCQEIALPTREAVKRQVSTLFLHSELAVMDYIEQAVKQGKAVCWIRNTVPDARSAWRQLSEASFVDESKLHLFHSRYTLYDRLRIEEGVLHYFGKKSTPEMRRGRVLVATQVVEQSLDLDFDVMISDLAPIDLLIQRAGRLQRHNRDREGRKLHDGEPDRRGKPVLAVLSPRFSDEPQDDWYKALLPKADGVYPHTLILWRTAAILRRQGGWYMPSDDQGHFGAREMLEFVYSAEDDAPEGLEKRTAQAIGESMSEVDAGDFSVLNFSSGYRNNHHWDEEARYTTRLGEDSQTVYLAKWEDGVLKPWVEEGLYRWDLSSLRVSERQLCEVDLGGDDKLIKQLEQLKRDEHLFRDETMILPVERSADSWVAKGTNKNGHPMALTYSEEVGLAAVGRGNTH